MTDRRKQAGDAAPAYHIDAEREVLGEMLASYEAIVAAGDLRAEYFSAPNAEIFQAIMSLHTSGRPVVLTSVTQELMDTDRLKYAGGPARVTEFFIASRGGSPAIAQYFAQMVREQWARRRGREIAARLQAEMQNRGADLAAFRTALAEVEAVEAASLANGPRDGLPSMVDGIELMTNLPEPPVELVHGLLHKGCKMVLGGASKSCKTWTLLDLGLCIAKGADWWGFPTTKGKVLFINFEIQPAFFARRALAVAAQSPGELEPGAFATWHLRGKSADISELAAPIVRRCRDREFALIVFDPLYKMLGERDENKAGDIAHLLNEFERIAVETGAAIAFGTHFSKGNQAGKESMDRIGGSGVFARDPDTILTLTHHEQKGAFTVEPILRNHPPMEPFTVCWDYPVMRRDDTLDPTKLKKARGRESSHSISDILDALGTEEMKTRDLLQKVTEETGMSRATFYSLLNKAKTQKKVSKSKLTEEWSAVQ